MPREKREKREDRIDLPRRNPRAPGTEVASRWEQMRPKMMAQALAEREEQERRAK